MEVRSLFNPEIETLAEQVLAACRRRRWTVAAAESCTGGLVLGALTQIAGSSDVVLGGVVSYANPVKQGLLGVPEAVLQSQGAVSQATARAMAEGVRQTLDADLSVSITGVAGPGGGTTEKPVGLVWFATARRGGETLAAERRYGDLGRGAVRLASVRTALELLLGRADDR